MKLIKAVVKASANALSLVKTLVENPTIISTTAPYFFTISLEVDSYRQYADADVAESVVISTESDAKKYIADNVAPRAWTWELSGYIPGLESIEQTNLYTPIVATNRLFMRKAFEKGLRLRFKDMYNKVWDNVVIQNLELSTEAECKNKQPFKMTLKKIDTLSKYSETKELGIELAEIAAGSIAGSVASLGMTGCEAVGNNISNTFSFFTAA
jgi:hypothetical protein